MYHSDDRDAAYRAHPGFLVWWSKYPKHPNRNIAKQTCYERWVQDGCELFLDHMLAVLGWQKRSFQWENPQMIPSTRTYMNQRRWDVDVPKEKEQADVDDERLKWDLVKEQRLALNDLIESLSDDELEMYKRAVLDSLPESSRKMYQGFHPKHYMLAPLIAKHAKNQKGDEV